MSEQSTTADFLAELKGKKRRNQPAQASTSAEPESTERMTDYEIPSKEAEVLPEAEKLNRNNATKLDAAIEHLRALFSHANSPQVGGRSFWGTISIEVHFQDGQAADILPSFSSRDRCVRNGR